MPDAQIVNFFGESQAIERAFEAFWDIYPRRTARGAARKSFEKVMRRGVNLTELLDAAQRYRDDPKREPTYTAHPSTWLNQERWLDEPPPTIAPKPLESSVRVLGPRETCGECDAGWLFTDDGSVTKCPNCG